MVGKEKKKLSRQRNRKCSKCELVSLLLWSRLSHLPSLSLPYQIAHKTGIQLLFSDDCVYCFLKYSRQERQQEGLSNQCETTNFFFLLQLRNLSHCHVERINLLAISLQCTRADACSIYRFYFNAIEINWNFAEKIMFFANFFSRLNSRILTHWQLLRYESEILVDFPCWDERRFVENSLQNVQLNSSELFVFINIC